MTATRTVKQEIGAINEAIDNQDMGFLAQYGGMNAAGRRYLELQKIPEENLAEATDFRRTGLPASRSRNEGRIRGDFRVPRGRLFYAPGTKGGVGHNFVKQWDTTLFLYPSYSSRFIPLFVPSCGTVRKNPGGR